ncbi:MAG: phosphoribosylglycinamide formyltransferase [Steroidobacter sp.]
MQEVQTASRKLPVVILISGTGSNMQRIAQLAASGDLPIEVRAVISDRADAKGLITAASMGIATAHINPKSFTDRAQFDAALASLIESHAPQLVVLAGFMRILTPAFTQRFAGRLLNIHPSLLPKYPGLHTHRRALDAHDAEHGATVHFVTEELDGGPAIIQARVPIMPEDDEQALAQRVLQQEHQIYPEAIRWFASGRLCFVNNRAWLDDRELSSPMQFRATVTP